MKDFAPDGLNLIIFVFKSGRFTEEEKEAFELISRHFKSLVEKLSLLVITNCGKKGDFRQKTIDEFRLSETTKPFADMMHKGIIAVNFPDISEYEDDEQEILLPKIKRDQQALHKIIAAAEESYLAKDIQDNTIWRRIVELACPFLAWGKIISKS